MHTVRVSRTLNIVCIYKMIVTLIEKEKSMELKMNDTIRTILERRSIRQFKGEQIPKDDLNTIIEAGIYAPSARNLQPWHITVIRDESLIGEVEHEIREYMLNSDNEDLIERAKDGTRTIFHKAPTILLVSGDESNAYMKGDCSNVLQNISLAAWSLGIGSCYIGMGNMLFQTDRAEEFVTRLEIPKGYKSYCWISLGYADGTMPIAPERKDGVVTYIE
mgnify:CR=1 FL=1